MKNDDFKIILKGLKEIKNIKYLENINTYHLLSKKEIKMLIGISSSVLFEAKYFGKKTHYLYKPVLDNSYTMIYKHFYKSSFWTNILNLKQEKEFTYLTHDNFLRYKYNLTYAYKEFMYDSILQKNYSFLQELYNFINSLDKDKKYILYGYGSIGKLIFPYIRANLHGIIDKTLTVKSIEDINVIDVNQLKSNNCIIISAFLYEEEIKKQLKIYGCEIISIASII
jgi:hypothetical protein